MEDTIKICVCCGSDDGFECIDPYAKDVGNVIVETVLCHDCYNSYVMDI